MCCSHHLEIRKLLLLRYAFIQHGTDQTKFDSCTQTYVDNIKDSKNEMFGLLLRAVTVTSKLLCWTWTKIYDWMITACLTVATAVCVPWQDKLILTAAMQSVTQCVTYQIVITAEKLYILNDTQLSACCTSYMNQNSILQHCKLSKKQ